MRKEILFFLLFLILFIPVTPKAGDVYYLRTDQEDLYLTPYGGRIGKVYGNTRMYVLEEEEGWCKVQLVGWIPKSSISPSDEEVEEVSDYYYPYRRPMVEIINWDWYTKGDKVYVVGEVRNNTDTRKKFVKIVAKFYDHAGNVVCRRSDYVEDYHIEPDETKHFAITAYCPHRIKKCGVYVETWGLIFLRE